MRTYIRILEKYINNRYLNLRWS